MCTEEVGEIDSQLLQGRLGLRRKRQQLVRPARTGFAIWWRFLDDCVCIRATQTKRADASAPDSVFGLPRTQPGIYKERAALKIDFRVGFFKVKCRWQLFMLERQHGLYQSGDSRCGIKMPDICLH